MELLKQKWALVGPGAIGLYYGGLLAKAGLPLSILARSDYAALKQDGIIIRMVDPGGKAETAEYRVRPDAVARAAADLGAMDCVLVTAKATVNPSLQEPLRDLVEPGKTVLLTLQNGMGNAEFLRGQFPGNPILAGLCFVCVNRVGPGVVENYLPGRVEIGSLGDAHPRLAESAVRCFTEAGIKTRFAPSLDAALWRKLCWNVPFNGLAIAAGGVTTDRILEEPELRARARRLMEEVRTVAETRGHRIDDAFLEGQFSVTKGMGAYRPSSLIDFQEGRPVEVEAIWGEPLRRGRAAGVAMPELERLYDEVRTAVLAR